MLVVGDEATLKVHVHTDEPERATALFDGAGRSRGSTSPTCASRSRSATERLAAARAANGSGRAARAARSRSSRATACAELYEGSASHVDGGPTLNPSTYDLLAGIHEVPAEEVVVLPNSANVIMAAERAAELSEKQVHVVRRARSRPGSRRRWRFDAGPRRQRPTPRR